MKNMTAQVELKSVDMKMSSERDFLRCLARLPMAEAHPGYGKVFLGCLAETAVAEAYPMENDVLQVSR